MHKVEESILDRLAGHTLVTGDATVFIILGNDGEPATTVSYRQLNSRVTSLAAQLAPKRLEGKRVVLIYQDILEFIVSFLACQAAGIIPVPVAYAKGNKQLVRVLPILEDAQAAAIFCTHSSIEHLQKGLTDAVGASLIPFMATDVQEPADPVSARQPGLAIERPAENEIAFIQYTSGSTGKPKGVVITARNLLHNQQLIKDTFGCDRDSVIFSWLPFHHDMGLIGNILHTIYVGCRCILMSPLQFIQTPRKWTRIISEYKVTHSGGPNFAYDLCVERSLPEDLSGLDLSSWKVAFNGSEPVKAETIQRFSDFFKEAGFDPDAFYPCYGLAEATLLVAGDKKTNDKKSKPAAVIFIDRLQEAGGQILLTDQTAIQSRAIVSAGAPVAGVTVKIISPGQGKECAELEEGEICISGDSITGGYWNKDNTPFFYDLGSRRFLRTGDLGFIHQGALFVHGRLTEMLIVRGRNIYPYDIEQLIAGCTDAIETNGVAVFSTRSSPEKTIAIAEIKRTFIKDLDAVNIIRAIDNIVAGSFGLELFDILLSTPLGIPRTTSGKLQRTKCKEAYGQDAFAIITSKRSLKDSGEKTGNNAALLFDLLRHTTPATVRAYLLNVIASKVDQLRLDPLQEKVELTEIGIDSLRAMELVNLINNDLGINLDLTTILQDNTLAGLITAIENSLWLKTAQTSGKEITI